MIIYKNIQLLCKYIINKPPNGSANFCPYRTLLLFKFSDHPWTLFSEGGDLA